MPHNPTRLNLDSSGRQVPSEEKSKPFPIFLMGGGNNEIH